MDSSARVGTDVAIASDASIGPFVVIGLDGGGGPLRISARATIRSHVVIYRGTTIGEDFHAGHGALIREKTRIGDRVSVGSHTIIEHDVTIEDDVRLHSRCFVPEFSILEEGAWLGPGVIVTNARYPNRVDTKANLEGVRVRRGAIVSAGVILLPGVIIGEEALVGAGAVVTKDVESHAVVVGNPARAI